MFDPAKPLPEPFEEVRHLWRQFIAEASRHVHVEQCGLTFGMHLDDGKLEVKARMIPILTDTPTIVQR